MTGAIILDPVASSCKEVGLHFTMPRQVMWMLRASSSLCKQEGANDQCSAASRVKISTRLSQWMLTYAWQPQQNVAAFLSLHWQEHSGAVWARGNAAIKVSRQLRQTLRFQSTGQLQTWSALRNVWSSFAAKDFVRYYRIHECTGFMLG